MRLASRAEARSQEPGAQVRGEHRGNLSGDPIGGGGRTASAPVSAAISKTRAGSIVVRLARGFPGKVVLGSTTAVLGTTKEVLGTPRIYRFPCFRLGLPRLSSSFIIDFL